MSIKDGYNSKKVPFHRQDSLDDKIDKLTSMMNKLTTHYNNQNKQCKPKIYHSRQRGQPRNYYDQNNYDQGNYQNRYRVKSRDRRTSFKSRGQYGQNYRRRPCYVNNCRNNFRIDKFRDVQNYRGQNFRGGYKRNYRNNNFRRGRSRSRDK